MVNPPPNRRPPSQGRSSLNIPPFNPQRVRGFDARGQPIPGFIHGQAVQPLPMAGPVVSAATGARSRFREQSIPDTPLVRQYRDPTTGEINLTAMRRDMPRDPATGELIQLDSRTVSRRSRARLMEIAEARRGQSQRKLNLLDTLPKDQYKRVSTDQSATMGDRYERRPSQALALIQAQQHRTTRRLQPQSGRSDDRANPWVQRSMRSMKMGLPPATPMREQYDWVKPVGPLGYGPQTPSSALTPVHTRQLEHFQSQIGGRFSQKQFEFLRRIQDLYEEDEGLINLYTKYRALVDPSHDNNQPLATRMVARPRAHFDHIETDRRYMRSIQSRVDAPRGLGEAPERVANTLERMKGKAVLKSTHVPRELRPLPEVSEDSDSEYETAEEGD